MTGLRGELREADADRRERRLIAKFDIGREEQVRGSVMRPRNKRGIKILHKECGHLLQGVTA